jgi:hypothetical protein
MRTLFRALLFMSLLIAVAAIKGLIVWDLPLGLALVLIVVGGIGALVADNAIEAIDEKARSLPSADQPPSDAP